MPQAEQEGLLALLADGGVRPWGVEQVGGVGAVVGHLRHVLQRVLVVVDADRIGRVQRVAVEQEVAGDAEVHIERIGVVAQLEKNIP